MADYRKSKAELIKSKGLDGQGISIIEVSERLVVINNSVEEFGQSVIIYEYGDHENKE